jgi:protein-histidine pros-kinase
MKLQVKFSLIFSLVFAFGMVIAGYWWHQFLYRNAEAQVMQQARLMMQSSLSARSYTSEQVKPLIDPHGDFKAQSVPAYAATEHFNYLRTTYPDYSYKEATLNPTNLRDRASDWEADVIHMFRDHAGTKEFSGVRDTPEGKSLFLARPIVAAPPCLQCHSTPQLAPANMVSRYGTSNGFGWQKNEIIGAQIVSVPLEVSNQIAERAFREFAWVLALVALALLIALNLVLYVAVVRPVRSLVAMSDWISQGNLDFPELPVKGNDEISALAAAFNRMHRSLKKAMTMLEQKSDGD